MWKKVLKAWSLYRHAAAIKTLLESIGLWKYVAAAVLIAVSFVLAYFSRLPPTGQILFGLLALACTLAIAGFVLALWKVWHEPPESSQGNHDGTGELLGIGDYAVHDALNLKITNLSNAENLTRSVLYLTRLTQWSDEWKGYRTVDAFRDFPPSVILANQVGLPRREPRIFQLLEFVDPTAPIVRTKLIPQNEFKEWHIPQKGIWRLDLQLRWDGGTKDMARCFLWSALSLPAFIECPVGVDLPSATVAESNSTQLLTIAAPEIVVEPGRPPSVLLVKNKSKDRNAFNIEMEDVEGPNYILMAGVIQSLDGGQYCILMLESKRRIGWERFNSLPFLRDINNDELDSVFTAKFKYMDAAGNKWCSTTNVTWGMVHETFTVRLEGIRQDD